MNYNFKVGLHNKLLAAITCYSDKEKTRANTNNNEGLSFIKEEGIFKDIVEKTKP